MSNPILTSELSEQMPSIERLVFERNMLFYSVYLLAPAFCKELLRFLAEMDSESFIMLEGNKIITRNIAINQLQLIKPIRSQIKRIRPMEFEFVKERVRALTNFYRYITTLIKSGNFCNPSLFNGFIYTTESTRVDSIKTVRRLLKLSGYYKETPNNIQLLSAYEFRSRPYKLYYKTKGTLAKLGLLEEADQVILTSQCMKFLDIAFKGQQILCSNEHVIDVEEQLREVVDCMNEFLNLIYFEN